MKLYVDKYNMYWSWDINADRMHDNTAAVYDALSLVYSIRAGMAWNDMVDVYGKMSSEYELRPNAHVFQLFNNYLRGDVAETVSSDEGKVVGFAVSGNGVHAYVLINRTAQPQRVTTAFSGFAMDDLNVQHHVNDADGYHM